MTTGEELRSEARRARDDADALRALAAAMDRSVIHDLTRLGGDRTWVGPTASRFEQAAGAARHELATASGDLRRVAAVLDHEAADLDRAARALLLTTV